MALRVRAVGLALLVAWTLPALAGDPPCDGRYFVHAAPTATDFDDRVTRDQQGAGFRLGLGRRNCYAQDGSSHWELDLRWTRIDATGGGSQVGAMIQRLRLYGVGAWQPYWQTGIGVVGESYGDRRHYRPALEAGVGVLRKMGSNGWALRLDASAQGIFNIDRPDDGSFAHDARVSIGVVLPISSGS